MKTIAEDLISLTLTLKEAVDRHTLPPSVGASYNPLSYAWPVHEAYIRRYGASRKRVLFLGINPGPFGMAQTGVPFGEIEAVRDFLKLEGAIGKPEREHPKRPILGFACKRSEVSGRRLWGLFKERFGSADNFFKEHYVINYCPLLLLTPSACNMTPDKLPAADFKALMAPCDSHLKGAIELLQPDWVVSIGGLIAKRSEKLLAKLPVSCAQILHPSPASPKANQGNWGLLATQQLQEQGVW